MGAIIDKPLIVNTEATAAQKSDKPLKPCCACPETKKIRDEWYVIISTVNILAKIMFEEITAIDKDTVNRSKLFRYIVPTLLFRLLFHAFKT